jgi:hypothetical protein
MSDCDMRRAARVIARLQVRFPNAFAEMRKDPEMMALMVEEWAHDLRNLSDDDIDRGLSAVRNSGSTFGPSLPEFVAMCKPHINASHQASLPAPEYKKPTPEKHAEHMKLLREAVRSVTVH